MTEEMFRAFNMGIGLIVVSSADHRSAIMRLVPDAVLIGKVTEGHGVSYR